MGEHTMEASGGFYDNSVVFENVPPGNPGDFGIVENPWRIKHPVVTFFHLLFRTLALIAYLLLSMDFWTVKNITGRIMAGLRWWNYVNDEGDSVWMFESATSESNKFSRAEIQIF